MRDTSLIVPKISVLMSVYNGAEWVGEAIESVLAQTYTDFEFIIVDDGSADSSLEILKTAQRRDHRIVLLNKENTGLTDSLNRGWEIARGKWIARIDADDRCAPHRFETQIAFTEKHPAVVLLGSGHREFDGASGNVSDWSYPQTHDGLLERLLNKRGFFSHSSAFFRNDARRTSGGYRTRLRMAQDYDMWLRLSELGEIRCLPEALVDIRKHANQISNNDGGRRQLLNSRIALVSYIARASGAPDPVGPEANDEQFNAFYTWMDRSLEAEGFYKVFAFTNALKSAIDRKRPFHSIICVLGMIAANPGTASKILMAKLFGEHVSMRLAKKWQMYAPSSPKA